MDRFTQFPMRGKDGYPNFVKSHLIIQLLGLKTGKITETLVFSEKKRKEKMFIKLQNLFSVKDNNYPSFYYAAVSYEHLPLLIDTFKCDFTE